MCVIFICDTDRASEDMIRKAYSANDAGAGIAWREPAEDGGKNPDGTSKMEVVWEKGLTVEEVVKKAAEVPLPHVMHFRIPSCGGKSKQLCHPFPITEDVELYLSGRTDGEVLFHNGHWGDWRKTALETAKNLGVRIPSGKLSDTRIMAWCAHHFGNNFVELIDEKGVAFSPTDIQMFWGHGWSVVNEVWVSNTYWQTGGVRRTGGDVTGAYGASGNRGWQMCKWGNCRNYNTDQNGYCPEHRTTPSLTNGAVSTNPPQAQPNSSMNKAGNATTADIAKNDANKAGTATGGSQATTPFAQFQQAMKEREEGKLSKKEWKRARNSYNKFLAAERKKSKQEKKQKAKVQHLRPGQLSSTPVIVPKNLTGNAQR